MCHLSAFWPTNVPESGDDWEIYRSKSAQMAHVLGQYAPGRNLQLTPPAAVIRVRGPPDSGGSPWPSYSVQTSTLGPRGGESDGIRKSRPAKAVGQVTRK